MKNRRSLFDNSDHSEKSQQHRSRLFIVTSDTWFYAIALVILLLISFLSKAQSASGILDYGQRSLPNNNLFKSISTNAKELPVNNFQIINQNNLKIFLG